MNARRIHIGDQAAAVLRDAGRAVSTNELARMLGVNAYEQGAYLWRELDKMARRGTVERIVDRERSCRLWRWAGRS